MQEPVAITTAIQEEILLEMGVGNLPYLIHLSAMGSFIYTLRTY